MPETTKPNQPPQQPLQPPPQEAPPQEAPVSVGNAFNIQQLQEFMKLLVDGNRQMIADAVSAAVIAANQPTPEEAAKTEEDRKRLLNARKQAARAGEIEAETIRQQQAGCAHLKPNGNHTFRGQIHSDGWATVRCIRCLKEWRVKPLPQHIANGGVLDLGDIPGLTVTHLDNWVKQSDRIEKTMNAAEAQMRKATATLTEKELAHR
jgi:hypothetical protein